MSSKFLQKFQGKISKVGKDGSVSGTGPDSLDELVKASPRIPKRTRPPAGVGDLQKAMMSDMSVNPPNTHHHHQPQYQNSPYNAQPVHQQPPPHHMAGQYPHGDYNQPHSYQQSPPQQHYQQLPPHQPQYGHMGNPHVPPQGGSSYNDMPSSASSYNSHPEPQYHQQPQTQSHPQPQPHSSAYNSYNSGSEYGQSPSHPPQGRGGIVNSYAKHPESTKQPQIRPPVQKRRKPQLKASEHGFREMAYQHVSHASDLVSNRRAESFVRDEVDPSVINEKKIKTEKDQLYYSKKARPVQYKPKTLKDYQAPGQYVELGKLQPDLMDEELVKKREAKARAQDYAKRQREQNRARMNRQKKPVEPIARELSKREKALEFAKRVPKPKIRPTNSSRSTSSNGNPPMMEGNMANPGISMSKVEQLDLKHDELAIGVDAIRKEFGY